MRETTIISILCVWNIFITRESYEVGSLLCWRKDLCWCSFSLFWYTKQKRIACIGISNKSNSYSARNYMLQPNIRFTLELALTVFTRLDITPPKVNRFGWNLEHSEYIVWGWPWQISGAIRAVARSGEGGKSLFFCRVNNARLYRFPDGQISRNLNTTRRSMRRWILSEHDFENLPVPVIVFPINAKIEIFKRLAIRPP